MKAPIARKLVLLYPRAWRERYEDEFIVLLEARGGVTWSDAIDVLRGAGREWARAIGRWTGREPAGELQALRRQTVFDLVVIGLTAAVLEILARVIAGALSGWTFGGGHALLMFVQAAVAIRCAFTYRRTSKRLLQVGQHELVVWFTMILAAAAVAHLDPHRLPVALDSWWLRVSSQPAFSVFFSVSFLMLSTPAAVLRIERQRVLFDRRRRDSVPSNPLGLR